ncbi:Uncharacterised protein [Mycobacteroides abscessus subsp. abscessus]|uniref:Uncharacterized protein n=1 Tax=Mycobacteroides abscessus subsp. abscessus TaxID=1185650 RepID=A0AB38D0J5_9MYCO|nr:hypothetical protein [Mycobacteroides abscessus]SHX07410.1 Uncharacterised protein [Mycobacteroides abscessus subsp. abscessus]SIA10213.1 Uncharacterised protein [Mycobacteroides abscessus subsp. abscessus]SIB12849.1 Uncharacterised protein [Mycobacteroides abscessus subsp. abscessus]SIB15721.1 Uncharacterised protein [Mycobacteroides abscessus subsp. abscessus]SIB16443.1 Uncharacterised protein [Mycobacteroides abscessus subsp. abscessus]
MTSTVVHSDQPVPPFGWDWRVTSAGPHLLDVALMDGEDVVLKKEVDILMVQTEGELLDLVHSRMALIRSEAIAACSMSHWLKKNWGIEC